MALLRFTVALPSGTSTVSLRVASGGPVTFGAVTASDVPGPHRVRLVGDGSTVYADVVPGNTAAGKGATFTAGAVPVTAKRTAAGAAASSSAGTVGFASVVSVPGASASSGAGAVQVRSTVSVPAASAISSAGPLTFSGATPWLHRVRVVGDGSTVYADMVPGSTALGAGATASAGAAPVSATVQVPGSSLSAHAGAVVIGSPYILQAPGAAMVSGAGAVQIRGTLQVSWAGATTAAGLATIVQSVGLSVSGAALVSAAGGVPVLAVVPLPGVSGRLWPGQLGSMLPVILSARGIRFGRGAKIEFGRRRDVYTGRGVKVRV